MNIHVTSYIKKYPSRVSAATEHLIKKKYLQPCLDQRHNLTQFMVSVDGMVGNEVKMVLQVLAARTVITSGKLYSSIIGYMQAYLGIIAAARATLSASRTFV
jgi:hypothetical protein